MLYSIYLNGAVNVKKISAVKQVVIVGGGLAGLINSILLSRRGLDVTLYEKKQYPFHRVCGEYISNEVLPFMKREGLYPETVSPSQISKFQFTSARGKSYEMPLDLGGFGISRFYFDNFLKERAIESGVSIVQRTSVSDITSQEDHFEVRLSTGKKENAQVVIGAYGKLSRLDKQLKRPFTFQKSPYVGAKYHVKTDFPKDQISLHNFQNGYCGISAIENGTFNVCYLGNREDLRKYGSIQQYEEQVLKQNPHIKAIFERSDFLFDKPEVINEFTFAPKSPVERGVLMTGDSAGLITPLCGNGMAMAIHSAKLLSDIITKNYGAGVFDHKSIRAQYSQAWNSVFRKRLWMGRKTQSLFGSRYASDFALFLMKSLPYAGRAIMKSTHGKPF